MKRIVVLSFVMFFMSSSANAGEWQIIGPRALGMGGAHVAVANDATANYWNPAAYGFFKGGDRNDVYGKRGWSAVVSAGAGAQVHEDLGEQIDNLTEYDYDALTDGTMTASEVGAFVGLVNQLKTFNDNKNRAVTVLTDAGLNIQIGHFGVGVIGLGQLSGKGVIDTLNIAPSGFGGTITINGFVTTLNTDICGGACSGTYLTAGQKTDIDAYLQGLGWAAGDRTTYIDTVDYSLTQMQIGGQTISPNIIDEIKGTADLATTADTAGTGGSIDDNESKLDFVGYGLVEVPLTYGRAINSNLSIGGNLKYMKARTYVTDVPIFDQDFADSMDDAKDNYEESTALGVDLAALYRFGDLRIGIVGRNLNRPKFDVTVYNYDYSNPGTYTKTSGSDLKLDPQVRAGIAYKPFNFLTLAADYDVTENDTTVSDDYKSQNVAVGAELDLFKFIQLRGGMYKNLSESDMGNVYTAGLGLNLWLVNLDAGISWASEKAKLDDEDYPKEVRGELAVSMLF